MPFRFEITFYRSLIRVFFFFIFISTQPISVGARLYDIIAVDIRGVRSNIRTLIFFNNTTLYENNNIYCVYRFSVYRFLCSYFFILPFENVVRCARTTRLKCFRHNKINAFIGHETRYFYCVRVFADRCRSMHTLYARMRQDFI